MKQLLLIIFLVILVLIFPLNLLQLPDDLVLQTKSSLRSLVHEDQVNDDQHQKQSINFNTGKIKMGMTKQSVDDILGTPHMRLKNEYHEYWTVYHHNYNEFLLVMYLNNKVQGVYSNQNMVQAPHHMRYGMTRQQIEVYNGDPLQVFSGENYKLKLDNSESAIYDFNDYYVTLFYDRYNENKVDGIKIISKNAAKLKSYHYTFPDDALLEDYATLHYQLINATRKNKGLSVLKYYKQLEHVAKLHAKDMAENHFFNHINLKHETPFDRMHNAGLEYRMAGENIAYGQVSPIEAHHGLMNSIGHRKNILKNDYENIGIGIAFNNNNQPYYVENYLTE